MSAEEWNLYSGMLRYFVFSFTNLYVMFFIMCSLLEKRRSLKVLWIYACGKIVIANLLFGYILPWYLGESEWLLTVSTTVVCVAGILNYVLLVYTFEAEFLRIAVVACGAEIAAAIVGYFAMAIFDMLEGREQLVDCTAEFRWMDLGMPVLIIGLLTLLKYCLRPFEKRMRGFELKHRKLLWMVAIGYPLTAMVTMVMDTRQRTIIAGVTASICISGGLLLVLYQTVRKYQSGLCRDRQFLNMQSRLMMVHYEAAQVQIHKMESSQQLIERQMTEIIRTKEIAAASGRTANYLRELRENYEEIRLGIYCSDWMTDAVLCAQKAAYEHQGINLECRVQRYDIEIGRAHV